MDNELFLKNEVLDFEIEINSEKFIEPFRKPNLLVYSKFEDMASKDDRFGALSALFDYCYIGKNEKFKTDPYLKVHWFYKLTDNFCNYKTINVLDTYKGKEYHDEYKKALEQYTKIFVFQIGDKTIFIRKPEIKDLSVLFNYITTLNGTLSAWTYIENNLILPFGDDLKNVDVIYRASCFKIPTMIIYHKEFELKKK